MSGLYPSGILHLKCSSCSWKGDVKNKELENCPECNAPISEEVSISFGGLHIEYFPRKNRFVLSDPHSKNGPAVIYNADFPAVQKFLNKHWKS